MGMFSGGFLGSGSDESKTYSTTNNTVNTTNETNMRDVGLTGQNAVDMAAVLGATNIQMGQSSADLLKYSVGQLSGAFTAGNKTLSGAVEAIAKDNNALVKSLFTTLTKSQDQQQKLFYNNSETIIKEVVKEQSEQYGRLLSISSGLMNPGLEIAQWSQKQTLYLGLAAVGAVALIFYKRGR